MVETADVGKKFHHRRQNYIVLQTNLKSHATHTLISR